MKNPIIASAICVVIFILAHLIGCRPTDALITMIAYFVMLDRLEKQDEE